MRETECVKCGANHPSFLANCQLCGIPLLEDHKFKRKNVDGFYIRKDYVYIDRRGETYWRVFISVYKSWWYRKLLHCYIIPIHVNRDTKRILTQIRLEAKIKNDKRR